MYKMPEKIKNAALTKHTRNIQEKNMKTARKREK